MLLAYLRVHACLPVFPVLACQVREAAGAAFNILFKGGQGSGSAVDSVVPSMLAGG